MASYGYGPPPPAPQPAPPGPTGYPQYSQPYHQAQPHGVHAGRGTRGGPHSASGRGDYQGTSYGYSPPAPQYGQQNSYPPASHPSQGSYPPQQWHHDQPTAHPHQQPSHSSLPPQNYHPNYAPQLYQQQPYGHGQQPGYAPSAQPPPYTHQFGLPSQPSGPPTQQWGGPPHSQNGPQFGHTRGRGGHHSNDRGGSKAQLMGPPIRIGFDNGVPRDHAAPVSNGYPTQSYGPSQSGTTPYAAGPYQTFPPTAPHQVTAPPHYDPYLNQSGRPHVRGGGFHNNAFRGRQQSGGDKLRHKKHVANVPTPSTHHQKPDAASVGKKKKRKTNTLGLTPDDESDDDDADEETKLLELIGPDAPCPTDLAAWLVERRKNFPTKARIMAKLADPAAADKVKLEGAKDSTALERQQQKAAKLRKQLEKVESSIKRKREQQDEGDEMRDVGASPSVSSDSKSDDEGPQALPARPDPASSLPPPPKKADPSKHCKYYSTGGTCGKKGKCRFVHDVAVREAALKERELNGGRMTLKQRLALNDKDQEDLTIVKTLQYLREKGLMKDCSAAASASQSLANMTPKAPSSSPPAPASHSYIPPPSIKTEAHPSLPPQPPPNVLPASHTVRYQGWNLSGFGNTGVKSGDS